MAVKSEYVDDQQQHHHHQKEEQQEQTTIAPFPCSRYAATNSRRCKRLATTPGRTLCTQHEKILRLQQPAEGKPINSSSSNSNNTNISPVVSLAHCDLAAPTSASVDP